MDVFFRMICLFFPYSLTFIGIKYPARSWKRPKAWRAFDARHIMPFLSLLYAVADQYMPAKDTKYWRIFAYGLMPPLHDAIQRPGAFPEKVHHRLINPWIQGHATDDRGHAKRNNAKHRTDNNIISALLPLIRPTASFHSTHLSQNLSYIFP